MKIIVIYVSEKRKIKFILNLNTYINFLNMNHCNMKSNIINFHIKSHQELLYSSYIPLNYNITLINITVNMTMKPNLMDKYNINFY